MESKQYTEESPLKFKTSENTQPNLKNVDLNSITAVDIFVILTTCGSGSVTEGFIPGSDLSIQSHLVLSM